MTVQSSIIILVVCLLITQTQAKPPHIIFILADDYGYHDIGYHDSIIKTPNLDQLASDGIKLENYYVQPICSPTRSQLMTGRYQIHTGLQHFVIIAPQPNCLPLSEVTLPQKLKESGYSTHLVGKWHLGFYKEACKPKNRGFDTAFGYLTGMEDYWTHFRSGPMPNFPAADHWLGIDFWDNEEAGWRYVGNYSTFVLREEAERLIYNKNDDNPMFLYLAFQAVHGPLQVPDEYMTPYKDIDNTNRVTYCGMVACMDEAVGKLVKTLKAKGMWNDTLLIFSTDNGGVGAGNNWPLRGHKNTLWEGGMRGIGFISGGAVPEKLRGSVSHQFMHVSDWFPTLVEGVAGGNTTGLSLDGFNQWPAMLKKAESPRKELLHNIDPLISAENPQVIHPYTAEPLNMVYSTDMLVPKEYNTSMRAAIRSGDWKLITGSPGNGYWIPPPEFDMRPIYPVQAPGQKIWLFNITADPNERFDLSYKYPKVVDQLVEKLKGYYRTSIPVSFPPEVEEANPALHDGIWNSWA